MKIEHFWQLFFVLVGAFFSAYATYYFTHQPVQNPVLKYEEYTDINLMKPLAEKGGIHIIYQEKELENISKSLYFIANISGNDVGKVKLYFEFDNKNNLPIFNSISSHKTIPTKAIKLLSKTDGVYVFEIDFFNKMERMGEGIGFNFYFVGDVTPKAVLKSGTKGLEIEKYEFKLPSTTEYLIMVSQIVLSLLFLSFCAVYLCTKYDKIKGSLIEYHIKTGLTDSIKKLSDSPNENLIKAIQESTYKEPTFFEIIKNWKREFKA